MGYRIHRGDPRALRSAFVIDSPPEIAELAVDLHEDLIQMPTPLGEAAHVRYSPLSDLSGEHRAKPVPPKSDSLMADVDPALGQQILDIAQRQRVSHVHHHDQTDHFWRAVEISERAAHGPKLPQPEAARKIGLTMPGRVWIADRGMASAENLAWLRETGRRYIIGAPKSELKKFAL